MGLLDYQPRKLSKQEWIEEQKFKKSKDCELCKWKRSEGDIKHGRCQFHRVGRDFTYSKLY